MVIKRLMKIEGVEYKNVSSEKKTASAPSSPFSLWLQREFTRRCHKNPKYSLRAFARLLKTDPSTLSQFLSGKRNASTKIILKMCSALGASPDVQEKLVGKKSKNFDSHDNYVEMAMDVFHSMSDWYHIAILELASSENFNPSSAIIAKQLGITATEAFAAIERLKRLELLVEVKGRLQKSDLNLTNFSPGITSSAHKSLQRQFLTKALDAVDNCPQEEKDITAITMCINQDNLPEARKLITEFRRKMSAFLEDGKQTRVYNLAIQLYPISNKILKEKK